MDLLNECAPRLKLMWSKSVESLVQVVVHCSGQHVCLHDFPAVNGIHCTISPPRFLAECHKRRLNEGSFVLLCFVFFGFLGCV